MEQGAVAKKLTGQILENWLLTLADGHGGIQTITKSSTSGLVDTYTISFADETTSTFTVTNGRSISDITTSKSGKVTTITIHYNDGTTSAVTVRDGEDISGITEYWAVSTSGSLQPQTGWQTTPPSLTATYKYLWHYTRYTYSDNTTTSTTPAVQGVYGDKGDKGDTGTSITQITKTGTSGLVDTYTVTMSNGTTTTFTVTNGSEIESVVRTSTVGLVDTYTVTMTNGDTHTFTVTNGRSIVSFEQTSGTHAAGTIDIYTFTYNDGDTSQIQVYNGANGTGAVSSVAGIGVSSADGDVPLIISGYGAPTTATIGQVNQLYFDKTGGIMYICISVAGGTYDWRGMSSAVDTALSTTSGNPVQNRVISGKVGVGSLNPSFSATNLTDAINELDTEKVPTTRTINGFDLSANRTLTAENITYNDALSVHTTGSTGKAIADLKGSLNAGTLINGMPQASMQIPANSDLNDYTTPGTYYVLSDGDAATISNMPRNGSGTLFVINRALGTYKTQFYFPTSSVQVYYVRNYNGGTWANWEMWYSSEKAFNTIANVLPAFVAPTGGLSRDEYVIINGNLYKALSAINASEQLNVGTNIKQEKVADHIVESGTWTPHIYDLNTYVRNAKYDGIYVKIGNFIILAYSTPDIAGAGEDFSNINTMLQFRNLPYNTTLIGGSTALTTSLNDYHSIQAAIYNRIYFRSNITSNQFTKPSLVAFGFFAFGYINS